MKGRLVLTTIAVAIILLPALWMQVKASRSFIDFENGLEYWEPSTEAGGVVQISTAYSHSGVHSLEQIGHSSGSGTTSSKAHIRLSVTATLEQYELSAWVYVTERSDANAGSFFGFCYGNNQSAWLDGSDLVGWTPWSSGTSYVYVRQTEGYQVKGGYDNPVPYGLTLNTWHQVNVTAFTNSGKVSVWLDGNLVVANWPAFNAEDHPTYYDIECNANYYGSYNAHQFVDDVTTSEISPNPETPLFMQWWFWTIIALGAIVVVLAFTTAHYRKKPSVSKGNNGMQGKTTQKANKVCPRCGANLPADSKFCGKCGTSLE